MQQQIKVYTVASNARRDARKAGLPVELDVVDGGWVIRAHVAHGVPDGVDKIDHLQALLSLGWQSSASLETVFGIPPHKLRALIVMLSRARTLSMQSRQPNGMLEYRIDPMVLARIEAAKTEIDA